MIDLQRYKGLCDDFKEVDIEKKTIRVNTLKINDAKLIKRFKGRVNLEKVSFLKHGYHTNAEFSLSSTPEYLLGLLYMQESASQIPALILDPKPGETVLDMAAAPGSKTTQMAAMMNNEGIIVALDPNNRRLDVLQNNLERMGISNTVC